MKILFEGKLHLLPTIISNRKAFEFIILSGIAGALSWLFYFLALKFGTVHQVAPLDKLSVVFATIIAALFLKEKVSFLNGVGVVMMAFGAIMVALS